MRIKIRYEPEVISKRVKRNKKLKKIFTIFLYLLLIFTMIFSLFLITLELGNSNEVPSFFNNAIYTVTSESMKPKMSVNDIIIVKRGYASNKYKVGNIITFTDNNRKYYYS